MNTNEDINYAIIDNPVNSGIGDTFQEEFQWLKDNLEEALHKSNIPEECYSKCPSIEKTIELYRHFLEHSNVGHDFHILHCNNNEHSNVSELLDKITNKHFIHNDVEINNDSPSNVNQYDNLINRLGGEFLGMYVSMHSHFENQKYPWGIYLFPEAIRLAAYKLYSDPSLPSAALNEYIRLMVYAVFRHEVFHYQVERYTTFQEISQRRNLYFPYKKTVYCHYFLSKECLEEALAESAAHKSKFIKNGFKTNGFSSREITRILEKHSDNLPAGYRDYDCATFIDEENAHKILAAQICYTTPSFNPKMTDSSTIKSTQFFTTGIEVPLYIVTMNNLDKSDLQNAIRITKI